MNIDIEKVKSVQVFSKSLNLLYVEDNQEARESTLSVLEQFFSNITTGYDGVDGLDKFKSGKYDLVITDINMPNKNGIDMIRDIRDINKDVPVLVVSAYSESSFFLETIKLNVEGYLLKPIELNQFIDLLSKTIEKIKLRYELREYQESLEEKVKEQVSMLRQKDELIQKREKLASMGEMIDAIAHQFRQPLGIIRLQNQEVEYILKEELKCFNDDLGDALGSSHKQINHLVETIEEFRRFFRTDTKLETIKVKDIFNSVLLLIKDELIKNNIIPIIDIQDDITIDVIPNEFKHILINLINNAKEAYSEDIKERQITLSAYKNDHQTILEVSDNAGGIPKDIIGKIFDSAFSTKGIEKGTGIGLYISKTIANKIGAELKVENIEGGAKFRILFQST